MSEEQERTTAPDRAAASQGSASSAPVVEAQLGRWDRIDGEIVTVRQGLVGRIDADRVDVGQGAVGLVRARAVDVDMGMVGTTFAGEATLKLSFARLMAVRGTVHLDKSGAGMVVANRVSVAPRSVVAFLVARKVEGDANALFDWRGALAFGAGCGLVCSLMRLRRHGRGRGRGRGR